MNTSSLKNSTHFLVSQSLNKLYKYNYMFLQISKTWMSGFAENVKFDLSIFETYLFDSNFLTMSFGDLNITARDWNGLSTSCQQICI